MGEVVDKTEYTEPRVECRRCGGCCRTFVLSVGDARPLEAYEMVRDQGERLEMFFPVGMNREGRLLWSCRWRGTDGLCLDYKNRPDTCRIFIPGSDPLCVQHARHEEVYSDYLEVV